MSTAHSYMPGVTIGIFLGVLGMKLFETLKDAMPDDGPETDKFPEEEASLFEPLKEALLSHALAILCKTKTHSRYYLYSGKYLPPFKAGGIARLNGQYMEGINRSGVYAFLKRHMHTKDAQLRFFNDYCSVLGGAVNEGTLPKNVPEDEEVVVPTNILPPFKKNF